MYRLAHVLNSECIYYILYDANSIYFCAAEVVFLNLWNVPRVRKGFRWIENMVSPKLVNKVVKLSSIMNYKCE